MLSDYIILVVDNLTGGSIVPPPFSLVVYFYLSPLFQCVRQATRLKAKQTAWSLDKSLAGRTHVTENLFTLSLRKEIERERGGWV